MSNIAIKSSNLTKNFGDIKAVDNLNLEIYEGEIFAFLGPNGAGKTTTIKLFTGLLIPTSGSVTINGYDIQSDPQKAKQSIGLISDQPFVYQYLSGFEFMRFVGDLYNVPVNEQKNKIPELLEMLELKDWQDDLVESYSHGMKQKLVFASMLLHNPKVLLLDEPLVGLDPKGARLVKDIFKELSNRGVTIFMSTHVLEIAEKLAHRVGIIQKGKVTEVSSVEALKDKIKSKNLEDIFLELTGGTQYAEMLKYL
ncbi:MAG: ABC transporter ATP-binding protein [Elusimicrobia bacterium]|nr:ABC transporter ATP-binding protein [Candidatus Liberimonas magnetica]